MATVMAQVASGRVVDGRMAPVMGSRQALAGAALRPALRPRHQKQRQRTMTMAVASPVKAAPAEKKAGISAEVAKDL